MALAARKSASQLLCSIKPAKLTQNALTFRRAPGVLSVSSPIRKFVWMAFSGSLPWSQGRRSGGSPCLLLCRVAPFFLSAQQPFFGRGCDASRSQLRNERPRICSSFGRTASGCAPMYSSTDLGTLCLIHPFHVLACGCRYPSRAPHSVRRSLPHLAGKPFRTLARSAGSVQNSRSVPSCYPLL
jgi:hypothetical protein